MKIYTNTFDLSRPSPHRFWVTPYSDFKFGIKIVNAGTEVANDFTVAAGTTELTPDADKIDGFTIFTAKSADTGFVEYTIDIEDIVQKFKLVQIITDSTVFEVGGEGGDVPADVATQTWVNSQISNFITEDALNGYATENYVNSAISDFITDDALTAYYTKSETSSATELADAFANVGGGAISAYDMSESPVWSKTQVETAIKTGSPLPQTIVKYTDNGISAFNVVGNLRRSINSTDGYVPLTNATDVVVGTQITCLYDDVFLGSLQLSNVVIPDSVTLIEQQAFRFSKIPTIKIPNSVNRISLSAFATNQATVVDFGNTRTNVPTLYSVYGTGWFSNAVSVYVPDNLYDTWIATTRWSNISAQIHRHSELEAPYLYSSKVTGGAETGTTGTPAAIEAVKSVYETDWATLSASALSSTFYVIVPDPE